MSPETVDWGLAENCIRFPYAKLEIEVRGFPQDTATPKAFTTLKALLFYTADYDTGQSQFSKTY